MSFRSRLLIGVMTAVLVPLAVLSWGVQRGITARLSAQYQAQVDASVTLIRGDLNRRSDAIAGRLRVLSEAASSPIFSITRGRRCESPASRSCSSRIRAAGS